MASRGREVENTGQSPPSSIAAIRPNSALSRLKMRMPLFLLIFWIIYLLTAVLSSLYTPMADTKLFDIRSGWMIYNLLNMQTGIPPKPVEARADSIDNFLLDLYKVYKASSLYPSNHPSLLALYVKPFRDISAILDETEQVVIRYKKVDGFFWGDTPVARKTPAVRELGERLFQLRIQSVFFLRGLKLIELRSLIEVITSEQWAIDNAGGCDALLHSKEVRCIWFNKIDFGKILEAQEEVSEKAADIETAVEKEGSGYGGGIYDFLEGEEMGTDKSYHVASHDVKSPLPTQELPNAEAGGSEEEEPPEDTDELIKRWRGERSYPEFEKTGNILVGRVFEAGSQGDGAVITKILDAYLDAGEQIKEEEFIEFISNRLDQMAAAKDPLDVLLTLACDKSSKDARLIETIARLKGRAAGRVADRLATEDDIGARKTLNNILVRMGKEIIPQLLERLSDERWYVVRNTVRILGEIGESHGVEDALRSPLVHKDPRVRKETVRALSMIRGPETINLMKSVLDDSDGSVVELALVSLGLLGDEGSVQALIDLVETRADSGVGREAVRALGRIGSRKAVTFLIKNLEKRGWFFGKRDDDLKVMCVSALADAGTPDAVRALEAGLSSSRDAVRNACEEELRRIRHE